MNADPVEIRVLGCLVEKQRTTPDVYPLTLNALRLACNQSTNRDPVVDYDEATVRSALDRLGRRRWTRLTSGHGSRAPKFRHLLDEALGIDRAQMALLAVLMLRGPQTPGELKQRSERLQHFDDMAALQDTLDGLIGRELVARLERRPGQKEERYAQLIGAADEAPVEGPPPASTPAAAAAPASSDGLSERVEQLESEVAELRAELLRLREDLGA
ncbi:MAG: YceH family protein [Thermoleophilaceae bacterium]